MANSTALPDGQPTNNNDPEEVKESFQEGKNNPVVKDALIKERQPVSPDDLSSLHNTSEIGTSGGDQRASENELEKEG